jgi:hypothetical protein
MMPACSVPVFRYALERWPAAPYTLIVLCEGQLNDRAQKLLSGLSGKEGNAFPNLTVRTRDRRAAPPEALPGSSDPLSSGTLPALVLRYPDDAASRGVVWSGPLSEPNVRQLLDSPLRRQIVQRLVQGDSAVWILLESGNAERDNAAAHLLQTRLEHHERSLTLPGAESGGNSENLALTNELRVAFSLLRLARTDPAEELLVRLLLGSEEDLNETREPIAFPIYGRGRVLYALVGPGINPETIDEACAFLAGPCSCVIKEQNPGLDLLLSADWDHLIRPTWTSISGLFELIGHRDDLSPPRPARSVARGQKASDIHLPGAANLNANIVLKRSLIVMGGFSLLVLTIGCWILLRKRN